MGDSDGTAHRDNDPGDDGIGGRTARRQRRRGGGSGDQEMLTIGGEEKRRGWPGYIGGRPLVPGGGFTQD
jgi:hypothetical protein